MKQVNIKKLVIPNIPYICYVTLVNNDLSHLPVLLLDEDGMAMYATYIATQGNRPDLFPSSEYPNVTQRGDYLDYDVPPEALEDEQFAAMLAEAEKYLGFPYVWGGSSPSTSFDCSGFVSWVINHSGWNVGRLGAKALCNLCTPVSPANARPGDLVFFINTYDAPDPNAPTHCGIYVGNNMMIHCGDPISYTGCEICAVNMAECAGKEPEPTPEPEPDPEPDPPTKKGMGSAPLLIVPVLALGGGAVYWLKFKKPKPDTKGSADLDDYDYGEDDDEDEDYETEGEDE